MALLNFFKKPKKEKAPVPSKRGVSKDAKGERITKPKKGKSPSAGAKSIKTETSQESTPVVLKESRTAWRVLRNPHVTEKATELTAFNQYVFRVFQNPSKPEIKRAVEEVYDVHVQRVRKIAVPRKKRRRGRHVGWKPGYKKAIVALRKGEKIEVTQ